MDVRTISEEPFRVSYTTAEEDKNVNGTLHGGILFYVCDEAVGRYIKHTGRISTVSDANIHYYRPVMIGETVTAELSVRKIGKTLGVFFVEAKNAEGKLLADSLFTVVFLDGSLRN